MSAPDVIVTSPMYTTITVNGQGGSRFLEFLGAKWGGPMPPALEHLVYNHTESVEVDTRVAEEVAEFIERLIADGSLDDALHGFVQWREPPLLFSANVGDGVAIVRDVLLEFQISARRTPRVWRFVPRGTRGRVLAHQGEIDRVLLEPSREIALVRPRCMTRVSRPHRAR